MRRLNQTFVTPFDRDDIYDLASSLDDCMDFMEEAADLIVLYKLDALPARVSDQVQVLQRAAELTAEAMPRLRSMDSLSEYWVEVNRLENQADKIHRKLLAQLFDEVTDPIQLMKLKEIVETARGRGRRVREGGEHRRDHRAQGVLSPVELALVIVVVAFALGFDYTNGFHDAANAIATSVSTRALTPRAALIMAAVFNLVGALLGTAGGDDHRRGHHQHRRRRAPRKR